MKFRAVVRVAPFFRRLSDGKRLQPVPEKWKAGWRGRNWRLSSRGLQVSLGILLRGSSEFAGAAILSVRFLLPLLGTFRFPGWMEHSIVEPYNSWCNPPYPPPSLQGCSYESGIVGQAWVQDLSCERWW